jgi:endoglycosylceramidase
MSFDPQNGKFRYRFRPDPEVHAPTRVFVSPLHYPDGYKVEVTNGRAVRRSERVLWIRTSRTDPVSVTITRKGGKA